MFGEELISLSRNVSDMYSTQELEENINKLIYGLMENQDPSILDKILGIGISFPGSIDSTTGLIADSSLLGGNIRTDLILAVRQKFGLPVFMENNVNLCSLNESLFGKGRDKSIVLFVFAGYGIGCGLTINGKMYLGATYSSGNVGHTVVDLNGKRCYCGSHGCLETIASYPALFKDFRQQVKLHGYEKHYELINGDFSCSRVNSIMQAANEGDKIAVSIINNIGSYVGIAIANLLGVLNPDLVIFGGDYLKVKDIILNPIKHSIMSRSWGIVKDTPIVLTDFGMMAEAHGAVSLIIKKFLKYGPEYFNRK